jgi:hypothetical protein
MDVYLLIREDQNEHGYVDTSVAGVFLDREAAERCETFERQRAKALNLLVLDDDCPDGQWQVAWKIEEHTVA